jgi:methylated-DNA-[protein]-cysteine S-methyltransferase
VYHTVIPSPLGDLYCKASDRAVTHVLFTPEQRGLDVSNHILETLRLQLNEYFHGKRRQFTIPFTLDGTEHQLRVWNALTEIPYAKTVTYANIAALVGSVPIAVGQAVGKNRINIVIPCHRVVGSDGSLTGYGGGLERKQFLLELESR